MQRMALDRLVSWLGLSLAVVLVAAGALLSWAHTIAGNEVHKQLSAQQIYFPAKGSPAIAGPQFEALQQYAGQQLTTGAQAKAFADHFIAVHLKEIGGGKTYAQLSAQAQANPSDTKLAGTVNSMFRGETLRGLLLNAYAFDTLGSIAGLAAIGAFIAAGLMLLLAALGFWHGRRTPATQAIFTTSAARIPATVG